MIGISVGPENQADGVVWHHNSRESDINIDSLIAIPGY
jgi:hypothetical protein